ncbi:hypothetical protein Rhal01_00576 [Rubritalea halochordaticola]|uniref:GYF domain-containing protein n=1 Tax=Rubritalea halochordaticola TaxID=714537 RepID=A0ABP9UVI1_9BACT
MSEPNWHYIDQQGQQQGPVSAENLQALAQAGAITTETQVWTEGLEEWVAASAVENLLPAQPEAIEPAAQPVITPTDPMIPSTPTTAPVQGSPVSATETPQHAEAWEEPAAATNIYPHTIAKGGNFGTLIMLYIVGIASILIPMMITAAMAASNNLENDAVTTGAGLGMMIGLFVGWGLLVFANILQLIYLYRAWDCLQPGGATVTPGKAVGFLFIPLFNLYWVFVAYGQLAKEWNTVVSHYENTKYAPRLSEGGFLTHAIGFLLPFLQIVTWFIVWPQICKGISFMANLSSKGATGDTTGGSGLNFGPTTIKGASSNLKFK